MDLDDTFDATVGSLFEPAQCILALSFAASLCFIVSACLRWNQLQKACIKIGSTHQANVKVVSARHLSTYQTQTHLPVARLLIWSYSYSNLLS
jgi:hypothetical protein